MPDYASQAHFNNYRPDLFGWPHRVPDLVPLQIKDPDSGNMVNFGHCARDVHPVFVALLTELVPHIPGGIAFGPHDDWAYSATDDLPDGSWSFHRYGIAFDLNWRDNPMGNYSNNPIKCKGVIPYAWAMKIAHKYGCEYGGGWSGGANRYGFKDYMHFECHLTPGAARKVRRFSSVAAKLTRQSPFPLRLGQKFGSSYKAGAYVRLIAHRYIELGYLAKDAPALRTGVWGTGMTAATKKFQARHGVSKPNGLLAKRGYALLMSTGAKRAV